MSVLRGGLKPNGKTSVRSSFSGSGITVKCPKCEANIVIVNMNSQEAVRCSKCHYPMISKADLLSIVDACRNPGNPNQVDCSVNILRCMADYLPEAGTALGALANQYPLPMSESERWEKLSAAYAAGVDDARDWLVLMCQTNSEAYEQCTCKNCGAIKFVKHHQAEKNLCIFCQSEG